ncbi:CUB domain-containing protein 1 isoform X1 [Pipistrellus kuhlii]|uniref:CUB domain containing protein 1 n=1 Tax=Pipistrellus kuhlii TaxID=59472 RepID=A0A7J7WCP6_PIPKU|nr:CUB domain-containing protein 1 isoform X1 [Pipistrellus kuhlii]KAF6334950.1 CUB domain containing protein 1 [Pipistrellus kuhlii]
MEGLSCGLTLPLLGALLLGAARPPGAAEAYILGLPPTLNITMEIKPGPLPLPVNPCYLLTSGKRTSTLLIKPGDRVELLFSCHNPEAHFVIEVKRYIDCTANPCPLGEFQLRPLIAMLPPLNRTFIWDAHAGKSASLELGFRPRLRQIGREDSCPDRVTYTVSGHIGATEVRIGTFCSSGTVSRIKMQESVKVTLQLPWFDNRPSSGFSMASRSSIKRLCFIESVFEGEGSATLMSANYPGNFPEDELMTWQFVIPAHLRASVSFLQFNNSNCEKKEERVEYYIPGSTTNPEVFKLADKQPGNMAGNFNLSLQGCDQDAQNPGTFRLKFQVLVQSPQNESNVTYEVDLSNERAMWVTIEPRPVKLSRRFVPGCFVCLESRTCSTNLTLAPGARHRISFLCDDLARLWVNAEKTISCTNHPYCHRRSYSLQVPSNILQLPVQLHDFSWKLLVPKDRLSLALVPAQKLQQHTQERFCNTSFSYLVTGVGTGPGQDLHFGSFCAGGAIEQIQVKQNVVVTLRTFAPSFQQELSGQALTVTLIPHFKEEGIFTVTPDMKSKVYLMTPNRERGLPPLASVSWNISVPGDQVAYLTFLRERTGLVCQTGRAFMITQDQRTKAEQVVSLEDVLPKSSPHHHNFWVNISNCSPVSGKQLDLLFQVSLTWRTLNMTAILIAVVGGGALLLLALGLIICLVKKNRKKKMNKGPAVGIYNGNINTQIPMQPKKFPNAQKDNDAHVYAIIDDTMVYGHLLQDSNGSFVQPEVDTYRPFQGPTEDCPPSFLISYSKVPTVKLTTEESSPGFPPETDSEPYTFSHPSKRNGSDGNTDVPLLDAHEPAETGE